MKSILVKAFLLSILSINAFGQTIKTDLKQKKQNSTLDNFTLEFLLATEQTKNIVSNKMDGTYTKFDTSLLQTLNTNNEFRYFLATRYIDTQEISEDEQMGNKFETFFFELMWRRKNILNQKDHGVDLTTELKNYWITDEAIKKRYGYDATFIPQVILKRNFGRANSVKLKVRRHFYNTNNDDNYTLNLEDRFYLSLNNIFARRFLLTNQIKYQHKQRKGNGLDYRFMELAEFGPYGPDFSRVPEAKKHQEIVTLHSGISYFIDRKNMIEFYGETKLSNTYDKRDLEQITKDEFVFGTALYLTAF